MKSNKRSNKITITIILLLIISISIGYSYLTASSQLRGDTTFLPNKWEIVFSDISILTDTTDSAIPTLTENDTILTFNPTLKLPGDEYSFSVNIRNKGTIDAMISEMIDTSLTPEQEKYATCSVGYYDGTEIKEKDKIAAGEVLPLKITVTYKEDLTADDLPSELTLSNLSLSIEYVPADETANEVSIVLPIEESWERIATNVKNGLGEYYEVGATKDVDLGDLGVHTLRVVNTSTPDECSTEGFSQSACGFVLEFADMISEYYMIAPGVANNDGGWRDCAMRTYVNNDLYNTLPEVLKNAVIDTTVVTANENSGEEPYITTDKLYLLVPKELTGGNNTDATRQLDYYVSQGATSSNMEPLRKESNSYSSILALRRPTGSYFYSVSYNPIHYAQFSIYSTIGVAPAFRIG